MTILIVFSVLSACVCALFLIMGLIAPAQPDWFEQNWEKSNE